MPIVNLTPSFNGTGGLVGRARQTHTPHPSFAGKGFFTGRFIYRDVIAGPVLFRGWAELNARFRFSWPVTASFAGSSTFGIFPGLNLRIRQQIRSAFNAQAAFAGRTGAPLVTTPVAFSAVAAFGLVPPLYILRPPVPGYFLDCALFGASTLKLDIELVDSDPINAGIDELAGEKVLWPQATGMEKALATVDAYRLTRIYAELVRDQWDPYAISYRNLPYLAWAMGTNLWEDWWSEKFKRYWVANQWTFKYERGSLLGLKHFTTAVGGTVLRAVTPPAKTFPTRSLTADERQAYLSRYPQLRMYPYYARGQQPYHCFPGGHSFATTGDAVPPSQIGKLLRARNGGYGGNGLRKMYPTSQTTGGRYMHYATLYDRGVETPLTVRQIEHVITGTSAGWGFTPGASQYDEQVVLPLTERVFFYLNQKKFLDARNKKYTVFTGKKAALRTITVSRSGPLPFTQGQITYQTIVPSDQLMELKPQHVFVKHPTQRYRMFEIRRDKRFVGVSYPMRSEAWKFTYDVWYLFDPDRVPPLRRSGQAYLGKTRLGMPKYTCEALIKIRTPYQQPFVHASGVRKGYVGKFRYLHKLNPEAILRLRRGVTASMALRDTVLINTKTVRKLQVRDIFMPDGTHTVGQLAEN